MSKILTRYFRSADAGQLQSCNVIKAKFKQSDAVLDALCFPERPTSQCKDVNQASIDFAYGIASDVAKARYDGKGRQLIAIDDLPVVTGPGWLDSEGLNYTNVREKSI